MKEEMKQLEEDLIWEGRDRIHGVSRDQALADYWYQIKKKKIIPRHGRIDVNQM